MKRKKFLERLANLVSEIDKVRDLSKESELTEEESERAYDELNDIAVGVDTLYDILKSA